MERALKKILIFQAKIMMYGKRLENLEMRYISTIDTVIFINLLLWMGVSYFILITTKDILKFIDISYIVCSPVMVITLSKLYIIYASSLYNIKRFFKIYMINLAFSILVTAVVLEVVVDITLNTGVTLLICGLLYFMLCIGFSLLSLVRVAKLTNNIISTISTLIFTIITFVASLLPQRLGNIQLQIFILELEKLGYVYSQFIVFLALFPLYFVGVGMVCNLIIECKIYFLEEYNLSEPSIDDIKNKYNKFNS